MLRKPAEAYRVRASKFERAYSIPSPMWLSRNDRDFVASSSCAAASGLSGRAFAGSRAVQTRSVVSTSPRWRRVRQSDRGRRGRWAGRPGTGWWDFLRALAQHSAFHNPQTDRRKTSSNRDGSERTCRLVERTRWPTLQERSPEPEPLRLAGTVRPNPRPFLAVRDVGNQK